MKLSLTVIPHGRWWGSHSNRTAAWVPRLWPRGMTKWGIVLLVMLSVLTVQAANVATNSLSAVRVYPNPWRSDKHVNTSIKFDGMPAGSTVKLFTVSAHEVKALVADSSGMATWDRTNDQGELVASGVYIYLIIDPAGNDTSGKLAIIK